jgi:hypothetical protein
MSKQDQNIEQVAVIITKELRAGVTLDELLQQNDTTGFDFEVQYDGETTVTRVNGCRLSNSAWVSAVGIARQFVNI